MNKIYINARFLNQSITGVQRFAKDICLALIHQGYNLVLLVPSNTNKQNYLPNCEVILVGKHSGLYWESVELPSYLRKIGSPLLLNLCNRAPVFYKNNIVVLHDVTFRRYPKSVSFSFGIFYNLMIPLLVKKAKKLLTVSQFSKNEILNFYPNCKKNIDIIYNAVDNKFMPNKVINKDNYLLAVSSDYLHKNFARLIEAFILLDNQTVKLKIVGTKGKIANKYQNIQNIDFIGRVSDEELIKLYQGALAFVFPSFYEGFGIPPLEAQTCGCPVISANSASMPEVLGDSALFFNPFDIEDISKKMLTIINDQEIRNNLVEKGYKNTLRFSWKSSAIKLIQILSIINEKQ